jgi:hypothetical protein
LHFNLGNELSNCSAVEDYLEIKEEFSEASSIQQKNCGKSQKLKKLHYLSTDNQLFVTFVTGSSKLQKENNYGFQIKV